MKTEIKYQFITCSDHEIKLKAETPTGIVKIGRSSYIKILVDDICAYCEETAKCDLDKKIIKYIDHLQFLKNPIFDRITIDNLNILKVRNLGIVFPF